MPWNDLTDFQQEALIERYLNKANGNWSDVLGPSAYLRDERRTDVMSSVFAKKVSEYIANSNAARQDVLRRANSRAIEKGKKAKVDPWATREQADEQMRQRADRARELMPRQQPTTQSRWEYPTERQGPTADVSYYPDAYGSSVPRPHYQWNVKVPEMADWMTADVSRPEPTGYGKFAKRASAAVPYGNLDDQAFPPYRDQAYPSSNRASSSNQGSENSNDRTM